ncbi:MAG: FAD-binding protein, partial [Actinomycetota bacterium]
MRYPHFSVAATRTTVNAAGYLVSGRKSLLLEGRYRRGQYRNWSGDRRHRSRFAKPTSEQEVATLVQGARSVRVAGSGHSFNDGLHNDDLTVSLDRLRGIVHIDHDRRHV